MTIEGKSNKRKEIIDELEEALGRGDIELDDFFYRKREIEAEELKAALSRGEINHEEFLQKSLRAGVGKLAVHGDYNFKDGGAAELLLRPDLDALASIYIMDLAGIRYNAVEFVSKGQSISGAINIDTGERKELAIEDDGSIFFDHHGKEKGTVTSAAQITYETLVENGFLKKEEWLDRFTVFVTEVDNLSYPIDGKFFSGSWANTLYGVYKVLPVEVVAGFFKKGKDPREPFSLDEASGIKVKTLKGEKTLLDVCNNTGNLVQMSLENIGKTVEKMKNQGIAQETPELGRVVMQTIEKGKKNKIPMGFMAAKALGYDTYIFWSDDYKSFFISSQTKDLTKIYERITADIPTAKLIRGTMILSPPNADAENLTLEKFLAITDLKKYSESMEGQEAKPKKESQGDPFSSYITDIIEELEVLFGEGVLDLEEFTKKREALKQLAEADNLKEALDEAFGEGKITREEFLEKKVKLKGEKSKDTRKGVELPVAGKEKITGPEAAKVAAETMEEIAQKNPFWKNLREKISGAGVKSKEIYETLVKTLQEKKVFGVSLRDHLINMGTGAAVRITTRWGLGFLTGGAGYLLAFGAGAVSGGVLEGRKAYKKEKNTVGLSEEEFAQKLQEIKEKAGKDLKKRIDIYSEFVKYQETSNLSEEKKKLRQELEKTFIKKAIIRGVLKGAAVGALGGTIGAALSDIVGHLFAPEKLTKAAEFVSGVKGAAGETAKKEVEKAAADASAKAYEEAVAVGLSSLRDNDFSVAAAKGEGQTQIARRLIRDFIAQNRALGSGLELNKARLIYAEDVLQKNFARGVVQPDHIFSIKGEKIAEIIEQAQNLGEEKLQNIQEKFVPKISEQTWGKITDYESAVENNKTIGAILAEAEEKKTEAFSKTMQEAGEIFTQAQKISPQAAEAKDAWFKDKWMKYGLGAAWIGAATGAITLGYKLGRRKGDNGVEGAVPQEEVSPISATESVAEPSVAGGTEVKKPEKITVEVNLQLRKILTERIGNNIEIAKSNISTSLEEEYDGLKRLENLRETHKPIFEKIRGSIIYMTTDKTKEMGKDYKGRIIIPIDPRLTVKQMRHYLEDATEKIRNLG